MAHVAYWKHWVTIQRCIMHIPVLQAQYLDIQGQAQAIDTWYLLRHFDTLNILKFNLVLLSFHGPDVDLGIKGILFQESL